MYVHNVFLDFQKKSQGKSFRILTQIRFLEVQDSKKQRQELIGRIIGNYKLSAQQRKLLAERRDGLYNEAKPLPDIHLILMKTKKNLKTTTVRQTVINPINNGQMIQKDSSQKNKFHIVCEFNMINHQYKLKLHQILSNTHQNKCLFFSNKQNIREIGRLPSDFHSPHSPSIMICNTPSSVASPFTVEICGIQRQIPPSPTVSLSPASFHLSCHLPLARESGRRSSDLHSPFSKLSLQVSSQAVQQATDCGLSSLYAPVPILSIHLLSSPNAPTYLLAYSLP